MTMVWFESQYGFRKHHNTIHGVTELVHNIIHGYEKANEIIHILLQDEILL